VLIYRNTTFTRTRFTSNSTQNRS